LGDDSRASQEERLQYDMLAESSVFAATSLHFGGHEKGAAPDAAAAP
jgi:hypothetical protein